MQHWGSERAAFGEGEDSMTRLEGAETGFGGRFFACQQAIKREGEERTGAERGEGERRGTIGLERV